MVITMIKNQYVTFSNKYGNKVELRRTRSGVKRHEWRKLNLGGASVSTDRAQCN